MNDGLVYYNIDGAQEKALLELESAASTVRRLAQEIEGAVDFGIVPAATAYEPYLSGEHWLELISAKLELVKAMGILEAACGAAYEALGEKGA